MVRIIAVVTVIFAAVLAYLYTSAQEREDASTVSSVERSELEDCANLDIEGEAYVVCVSLKE